MASAVQQTPLRVLMLHGFTQSGSLFHAKTRALEKSLKKAFPAGIELVYPTGPTRIHPADIPNFGQPPKKDVDTDSSKPADNAAAEESDTWGWWIRRGSSEPYEYDMMEKGLDKIAEVLKKDGPFDGVIGFSQGGAAAGLVASLLEEGRRDAFLAASGTGGMSYPKSFEDDMGMVEENIHPPLKFAISYSGYGASNHPLYQGFYNPKIKTPMLHVLGSTDTVVEEVKSMRLVRACADGGGPNQERVIRHPGGHFVPASQKQYVNAVIEFIRDVLGWSEKKKSLWDDTNVEDMDVPF